MIRRKSLVTKVELASGSVQTGTPIVYGITVPTVAANPEMGMEFVKFVIGEPGQKIFADNGQPPIVPPAGSGIVLEGLMSMVKLETTPTPNPTETPTPTALQKHQKNRGSKRYMRSQAY